MILKTENGFFPETWGAESNTFMIQSHKEIIDIKGYLYYNTFIFWYAGSTSKIT